MLEKDTGKKLYYKFIFYFITGVFSVAFFTLLLLTNGYSMRGLLYAQRDQTFMDFFNSMLSTIGNPYEHYSFYPPFAMMFYKLLLMLVPQATLDKVVTSESSTAFSTDVKLYQQLYFPFIIYALLSLTMLFVAIKSAKKALSEGFRVHFPDDDVRADTFHVRARRQPDHPSFSDSSARCL